MNQIDIKNRLKNLRIVRGYKTCMDREIAKSINKNNELKLLIRERINLSLEKVYYPLGQWLQNPTSIKQDFGVVINGIWSTQNQFDTNHWGHPVIFNKCNLYLHEMNKDQIVFELDCCNKENIKDTKAKILSLLDVMDEIRNEIFHPDSDVCKILIDICDSSMKIGDDAQKFCVDHISDFFNGITKLTQSFGRGDYNDRKEGIDVWIDMVGNITNKIQIKNNVKFIEYDDYYIISANTTKNTNCNYYFFVDTGNRIVSFKNGEGIDHIKGIFPKSLLYKDLIYTNEPETI